MLEPHTSYEEGKNPSNSHIHNAIIEGLWRRINMHDR
jgi:hypothetical protein